MLVLIVGGTIFACAAPPNEAYLITRQDNLAPTAVTDPAVMDEAGNPLQNTVLISKEQLVASGKVTEEVAKALDRLFPGDELVAVTTEAHIVSRSPADIFFLQLPTVMGPDGQPTVDSDALISQGLGVVGTAWPQTIPFVGLAGILLRGMFSKRQRSHGGALVQALNPFSGGDIRLKEAAKSFDKMIGGAHTEESVEELLATTKRLALKEGKVISVAADGTLELKELQV